VDFRSRVILGGRAHELGLLENWENVVPERELQEREGSMGSESQLQSRVEQRIWGESFVLLPIM